MKYIFTILTLLIVYACNYSKYKKKRSVELITSISKQDSIFHSLCFITDSSINVNAFDSLAFLILPVQVSCPSCRKKVIDSIVQYQRNIKKKHFVIISANGGRKIINSYFREQDKELPTILGGIFLDSTNAAINLDLCKDKPVFYYTFNGKAYKKVSSTPSTVKDDLREFFSGH